MSWLAFTNEVWNTPSVSGTDESLQKPDKNTAEKGGSDHFDLTSKRAQRTKAWDPCQREEELETKPTQKESPRSELRSRRYDRNGIGGASFDWNTLSRS